MKDKILTTVISTLIVLVAIYIYGKIGPGIPIQMNQTNKIDQQFSVTGEGKVTVKPDIAQVVFGVNIHGSSVSQVQSEGNKAINKVVAEIKKLGVNEDDIKTSNYNVNTLYSGPTAEPMKLTEGTSLIAMPERPSAKPTLVDYNMNANVTVKVRDLDNVNKVIDTATKNGANQIGEISFTVDNKEKYQAEARKLAVADAKKKATEIAKETAISLGRVVNFYENMPYYPAMAAKADGMGAGVPQTEDSTQIQPGTNEITVQITLTYELK